MKYAIALLFVTLFSAIAMATPQAGDYLIVGSDTSYIYNILSSSGDSITREKYFDCFHNCLITSSYRGYQNFWMIENDSMFLVGLQNSCDRTTNNIKNLRIFAHWIHDEIFIPKGEKLKYMHDGYGWYYEYEVGVKIDNGIKGESIRYNNTANFYISPLEEKENLWNRYCYFISQKDLSCLDSINAKRTIVISIETDGNGFITDTNILRSSNDKYLDDLAVDMINSLSRFSVYYRFGKQVRIKWSFPINFESILNYCN